MARKPRKRQVPPGSREEAQIAESVIYGLIHGVLQSVAPLIREQFNYLGATIHPTGEARGTGVVFDGLTIHMASGDYKVTIKQAKAR